MHWDRLRRPYAASTPPESSAESLVLGKATQFKRRLTQAERLVLALSTTSPRAFLTLDSRSLSRSQAVRAWRLLAKRLTRSKKFGGPLIYLAFPARTHAGPGYHIHAFVWQYLHQPTLGRHAREVGFGPQPWITTVPHVDDDPYGCLKVLRYGLGQEQPIFGSSHHKSNVPSAKGGWRFLRPQDKTLAARAPQLLSALKDADSQALSDDALAWRTPMFSRYRHARALREGVA